MELQSFEELIGYEKKPIIKRTFSDKKREELKGLKRFLRNNPNSDWAKDMIRKIEKRLFP